MMVISHNLSAMNTQRQLKLNTTQKTKSAEKLSSGFRINRAADDAAGLSISEKMRYQIRGLDQGAENIEDGISFLQVADGAMHEIDAMLGRLTELSVQAANGTLSDSDRAAIDEEAQAIKLEIDRINDTTTFNTRKVFVEKGSIVETKTPTATSKFFKLLDGHVSTTGYMEEEIAADYLKNLGEDNYTEAHTIDSGNPYTGVHIDFTNLFANGKFEELCGAQFYVNCCTDCCPTVVQFEDSDKIEISKDTPSPNVSTVIKIGLKNPDTSDYYANASEFNKAIVTSLKNANSSEHVEFASAGDRLWIYDVDPNDWSLDEKKSAYFCDTTNIYNPGTMIEEGIRIHMSSSTTDGWYIGTGYVDTKALGINTIKMNPMDEAIKSIDKIKLAVSTSSRVRSYIGAQQNRLENSLLINNNTAENTQFAESRIRDTDMAEEMVTFSMRNILDQAGQSMLAQANQSTQGVLQLLQ